MKQRQIVRWEDPPPSRTGRAGTRSEGSDRSSYDSIADQLRDRQGEWALIEETVGRKPSGIASKIRRGGLTCFAPRGDFDAVTRHEGDRVQTYARYLGDGGFIT